jgi:uncharacterized protein YkwD
MPITTPPPPPVPAAASRVSVERAIARRVNAIRRSHGLRRISFSVRLRKVARRHSRDMLRLDSLTHYASDGTSLSARLSRAGRRRHYAEVIAWTPRGGPVDARTVVRLWMRSPSHRAVLLNGSLRRIGVGRVSGSMGAQRGFAVTADFSS